MERKAKIVATIGPASQDKETLVQLTRAGMNVARLNFSHGTHDEHAERIRCLRAVSEELSAPIAILQDLQGPKIRVGELAAPLDLEQGEHVCLYLEGEKPPEDARKCFPADFPELFDSVKAGDRILMDDGHLALHVEQVSGRTLHATVTVGGKLLSHKGINLPGVRLTIPGFTDKDRADLLFGLSQNVDMVAISFVRTAGDVLTVRDAVDAQAGADGSRPMIIAKLEKPEALGNLDGILQAADGVMVARGDLGVEMLPERVPIAQKHIITEANRRGKLVITATQMLDSMITSPLPTRAEASDVANAVFDGTDAVMLSAETASGAYPIESVTMMDRIAREAEANFPDWGHFNAPDTATRDDAASTTRAARELAHDLNVTAIAVFTHTGRSALLMSKARPQVPIFAFTHVLQTYHRMAMFWGVIPQLVARTSTLGEMVNQADSALMATGWAQTGQQVVVICGFPVRTIRPPNMALLHNVGEKM
jgi:pyruvate kinase